MSQYGIQRITDPRPQIVGRELWRGAEELLVYTTRVFPQEETDYSDRVFYENITIGNWFGPLLMRAADVRTSHKTSFANPQQTRAIIDVFKAEAGDALYADPSCNNEFLLNQEVDAAKRHAAELRAIQDVLTGTDAATIATLLEADVNQRP